MQIEMQNAEALTGQQITEFLKGSEGIAFTGGGPGIDLRMDGAIAGRAGVCGQGEEGAGLDPQVCVQGYGAEPSANDKADPELPGDGNSGGEAEPETTIPGASTQKGMCACWQRWTMRTSG